MKTMIASLMLLTSLATSAAHWTEIKASWEYMPGDDTDCGEAETTLTRAGKIEIWGCGERAELTATPAQLRKINRIMDKIMVHARSSYVCKDQSVQDYSWDYKIKVSATQWLPVFMSDGNFTCARVGAARYFEQLDEAMNELSPDTDGTIQ